MKKLKIFIFFLFLGLIYFLSSSPTEAASFYQSPASGNHNVGDSFTINVLVSSPQESINAVSGVLTVDPSKLQITGVSSSGTKVGLWVQQPSFSKSSGRITFEGIILNPGYTGSSAKIISISVKALSEGKASIVFASGSILANDGNGTNVMTGGGGANFTIAAKTAAKAETVKQTNPDKLVYNTISDSNLEEPQLTINGNPEMNRWLNTPNVNFTWNVPANAQAIYLLVDNDPSSTPMVAYSPAIFQKTINNLNDGKWYLHAYFKNSTETSGTANFAFNIDTVGPDPLKITQQEYSDQTNPQPSFLIETADSASGLDYFTIQIDNGAGLKWQDDGTHIFKIPFTEIGDHLLKITAFDKAGNSTVGSQVFTIKEIAAPQLTDYPGTILLGSPLSLKGVSETGNQVNIIIKNKAGLEKLYTTQVGQDGKFAVNLDYFPVGTYQVYAQSIDGRGAKSLNKKVADIVIDTDHSILGLFPWLKDPAFLVPVSTFLATVLILGIIIGLIRRRRKGRFGNISQDIDNIIDNEFNILEQGVLKYFAEEGHQKIKSLVATKKIETNLSKLRSETKTNIKKKLKKLN